MARDPASYARELRWALGCQGPVDPREIAEYLGIPVIEEPLDVDGLLLLRGDGKARILVSDSLSYESRKAFTVAHELGHFLLPGQPKQVQPCSAADIFAYHSDRDEEKESNEFASELLLPESEVTALLNRPPDMGLIKHIADQYGTSLTATAVKVAKVALDPVAVVLAHGGIVKWFVRSQSFPYQIRLGPLSDNTCAADHFGGRTIPGGQSEIVRADAWCTGVPVSAFVQEESIPFTRLGMVLTILSVPRTPEDEDDEDSF